MTPVLPCVLLGTAISLLISWLIPKQPHLDLRSAAQAHKRRTALGRSHLFRLIEPIIRLLSHHLQNLPGQRWRKILAARLLWAGEPVGLNENEFVGLMVLTASLAATVSLFAVSQLGIAVIFVLGFLGAYYPIVWLNECARIRLHGLNKSLPYANDILVLALQAGQDFVGALRQYVRKFPNPTDLIAQEFARILGEIELGSTRRAALEALATRAPTEPVRAFVNAVVQAERRGTSLCDALQIQASALRTQRSLQVEKLANRAGVLILLPLLLLFSATLLMLFGGVIVRAARGELL